MVTLTKLIERIIEAALILSLVWLLSGCNTLGGFGKDLQRMSEYNQPAATDRR